VTDHGVFAGDRLDRGTETLLRRGPQTVPDGDVLDLGCGYGPIAVTLARRNPRATVWAVDVNERARALCAENARAAGAGNVRVAAPDEMPADLTLAGMWTNPPIRIGKQALHDVLVRWLDRLQPDAVAHLVVHKHLGSDSLARWLGEHGYPAVRRASHDGYRLLDVRAKAPADDAMG
jgi:16S rRNA (guanine1207-N2)-methyltransferase